MNEVVKNFVVRLDKIFSSEDNLKKIWRNYPENICTIKKMTRKEAMDFISCGIFKSGSCIQSEGKDSVTHNYKTLYVKKELSLGDLGKALKNVPGWKKIQEINKKYCEEKSKNVDIKDYFYNKTHIIARELGGVRFLDKYNKVYNGFIGTRECNVGTGEGGMREVENSIKKCLEDGKTVMFEAIIIYKNQEDIIPLSIIVTVVSCDLEFNKRWCVFNVKRGYIINYKTGSFERISV